MIEVTQQDRDAAEEEASAIFLAFNGKLSFRDKSVIKSALTLAFAKRAEQAEAQTVAEIVAWLRGQKGNASTSADEAMDRDNMAALTLMARAMALGFAADAIEQRAYK